MDLFPKKVKNLETLERILDGIKEKLEKFGYAKQEKYAIMLATDELVTNAVSYTTKPSSVSVKYSINKAEAMLRIKNKAEPFNWEGYTTYEHIRKINDKQQLSGRGIYLTNKFMDELNFEFKKGYVIAYARYKRK